MSYITLSVNDELSGLALTEKALEESENNISIHEPFSSFEKMVRDIQPKFEITRMEALAAFNGLREQAKDVPEMSIDEINAEIKAARAEKRARNAVLCSD